jgi:hypothetical protein
LELVAASYTSRRVDRALKKVDLAAKDVKSISAKLAAEVGSIVPADIYTNFKSELEGYVNAGDLESTLKVYDNKGLFALASKHLGLGHPRELRERVSRLLGRPEGAKLRTELQRVLPIIP